MDTNMRAPPPQGTAPTYAFVTRYYKRSLRPVVIAISLMTAVWSLFAGIAFYRNVTVNYNNNAPKLAVISIVVGSLYMVIVAIGLFGTLAAGTQKLGLIRTHAYLSVLAVLTVAGIGLLKIIVHFTMKDAILKSCTDSTTGLTYVYAGWWGPVYSGTLSSSEATRFCNRSYERDSWSQIVGFLILTAIGIFFCTIIFSYLRQCLDPSGPGNVTRDPRRVFGYTPQYQPPYGPPPGPGPTNYYNYPAPGGMPQSPHAHAHDNGDHRGIPPPVGYDNKPPGYVQDGYEDYDDLQKGPGDTGVNNTTGRR